MTNPTNEDSPKEFLARVANALLRVCALAVIGAVHFLIEKALIYIIPANAIAMKSWLEDISFVFFVIIYVYLLWDMLKVFIPQLQAKPYPKLSEAPENDG